MPQPHAKNALGFSLVELLALIVMIALLAALLLPALSTVKQRAWATTCLNNAKQLNLAWVLYASENREVLPSNPPLSPPGSWVRGVEDMSRLNTDNTNSALMMSGTVGSFAKDATIYHCPSDVSFVPGLGYRVRSVAMNAFVGFKPFPSDRHKVFLQMTDFNRPSDTYVLLEEHPDSINDGWFLPVVNPMDARDWQDLPAAYHDRGCNLSYADGHVALHRWLDITTLKPIAKRSRDGLPMSLTNTSNDLAWMMDHMSTLPNSSPTNSP